MDKKRVVKIMQYANRIHSPAMTHPPSLQVALTDRCFNQCPFCDHWKRGSKYQLPTKEWLEYLSIAGANGLETVCYIGGDSLAHPDINEIMEYHIDSGIDYGFVTTGYVPNKIDIELLSMARWIRCSLDAITPAIYSLVRGGVSIDKVIDSIIRMINIGCNVEIYATAQNINFGDMENVIEFALKNSLNMNLCVAEDGTCDIFKVDISQYATYANQFDEIGKSLTIANNNTASETYKFNHCNAVFYQLYIAANGDIYPCCHTSGDITLAPHMPPLANIKDDWALINSKQREFSLLQSSERPKRCRVCTVRFQSINHIAEESLKNKKAFF